MVERLLCKQDVVGSTPSGSTIFLVLTLFGLLEHCLSALLSAPRMVWHIAIISRFAADLRIGCIDIVKEEFVRPLIGFQDRFERRHCLTKIRRGPPASFQSGGINHA